MVIQSLGRGSSGYKEAGDELGRGLGALGGAIGAHVMNSRDKKRQIADTTEGYIASGVPPHQAAKMARADAATQRPFFNEHIARGGLQFAPEPPTSSSQQQEQPQTQSNPRTPQFMPRTPQFMPQASQMSQSSTMQPNLLQVSRQGLGQLNEASGQGMMSGQPRDQLAAAQSGIAALQQAQLRGATGYPDQQRQLSQQNVPQQRQPGQFPSASTPTGQPMQLPAEGQRAPSNAMRQQPGGDDTWQKRMAGPTTTKLLQQGAAKDKAEIMKIDKEAGVAEQVLPLLEQIYDLNREGKAETSQASFRFGPFKFGGKPTQVTALLGGIPAAARAEIGGAGTKKERAQVIKKWINKYQQAEDKKHISDDILNKTNGFIPGNFKEYVNDQMGYRVSQGEQAPALNQSKDKSTEGEQTLGIKKKEFSEDMTEEPRSSLLGQAAAPLVRAGETVLGLPGTIDKFVRSFGEFPIEKQKREERERDGIAEPYRLPTIEGLREKTKELTGDTFEPEGYASELYQDIASKAILMLSPTGPGTLLAKAGQALLGAGAGVATREALRVGGAGPVVQALGEVLVGAGASSGRFKDAVMGQYSKLVQEADAALTGIPKINILSPAGGATAAGKGNTKSFERAISEIANDVAGRAMKGRSWMMDRLKDIMQAISGPYVPVKTILNAKKDLLTWAKKIPEGAEEPFKKLMGVIDDSLRNYGAKNPDFGIPYAKSEVLLTAVNNADKVRQTIEKSRGLSGLTRNWAVGPLVTIGKKIVGGSAETANLLIRNPEARRLYSKAYASALAGNVATSAEYLRRQSKALKDEAVS